MAEKYFIYARKSTDVEDKQVLSIEAQIAELKKYAKDKNRQQEELMTGGRIIRPAYKSVCAQRNYVKLDDRLDNYPGELRYIPSDEHA